MGAAEQISFGVETNVAHGATADLANYSFQHADGTFSEDYLKWLYGAGFGGRTTVVAISRQDQKIGQAVILWHAIRIGGAVRECAQLIDLFVVPEYRSFRTVRGLALRLSECLNVDPEKPVLTMPNAKAAPLNRRLLKLHDGQRLDIRGGICSPKIFADGVETQWFSAAHPAPAMTLMAGCVGSGGGNEVYWTPATLAARLSRPDTRYAVLRTDNICMISRHAIFRHIPCVLICGLFCRDGTSPDRIEINALLRRAARLHGMPLYVYVGLNDGLPLPGFRLPADLRPSPMRLQTRGLGAHQFNRFEAIDFDFA